MAWPSKRLLRTCSRNASQPQKTTLTRTVKTISLPPHSNIEFAFSYPTSDSVWPGHALRSRVPAGAVARSHQQRRRAAHWRNQFCGELPPASAPAGSRHRGLVRDPASGQSGGGFGQLLHHRLHLGVYSKVSGKNVRIQVLRRLTPSFLELKIWNIVFIRLISPSPHLWCGAYSNSLLKRWVQWYFSFI